MSIIKRFMGASHENCGGTVWIYSARPHGFYTLKPDDNVVGACDRCDSPVIVPRGSIRPEPLMVRSLLSLPDPRGTDARCRHCGSAVIVDLPKDTTEPTFVDDRTTGRCTNCNKANDVTRSQLLDPIPSPHNQ